MTISINILVENICKAHFQKYTAVPWSWNLSHKTKFNPIFLYYSQQFQVAILNITTSKAWQKRVMWVLYKPILQFIMEKKNLPNDGEFYLSYYLTLLVKQPLAFILG